MTGDTAHNIPGNQTETSVSQHHVLLGFLRQLRYVVACIVVGIFFIYLAGKVIPSPNMDGTRALAAGPAISLLAELVMIGGLVAAIVIGTLLTWPDAPHAGLFIASVGLIFLACHWGPITLLLALHHTDLVGAYHTLALQNIFWIFYILIGEAVSRGIYELIGSRNWPLYLGLPWPVRPHGTHAALVTADYPSFAEVLVDNIPYRPFGRRLAQNLLAFITTLIVAAVILFLLLKSQQPGQAIFACSVAFAAAAFVGSTAAPQADAWVIWLTPPVIAAIGGIIAPHVAQPYPAHTGLFLMRSLPIYYSSAGLAGAIFGYYAAVRMHYRRVMEAPDSNASA